MIRGYHYFWKHQCSNGNPPAISGFSQVGELFFSAPQQTQTTQPNRRVTKPVKTSQRAFKAGTLQHPKVGIDNVQKQGRVLRAGFKGGLSRVISLTVVWGCWMWLVKLVATPQVLRMIGFKRFKSVQIFMKHQDARNILFFWWSACWRNISNSIFTAGTWHTNSTKAWDLPHLLYTCYM